MNGVTYMAEDYGAEPGHHLLPRRVRPGRRRRRQDRRRGPRAGGRVRRRGRGGARRRPDPGDHRAGQRRSRHRVGDGEPDRRSPRSWAAPSPRASQAQWSGNSPTYNFQLLGTDLAAGARPVLHVLHLHPAVEHRRRARHDRGRRRDAREAARRARSSRRLHRRLDRGLRHPQILEQAAANGDMTRAGVVGRGQRDHRRPQGPRARPDVGRRAQRLHRAGVVHVHVVTRQLHAPAGTVSDEDAVTGFELLEGPFVSRPPRRTTSTKGPASRPRADRSVRVGPGPVAPPRPGPPVRATLGVAPRAQPCQPRGRLQRGDPRRCAGCRSTCPTARSSPCWGPTGPARGPRCGP